MADENLYAKKAPEKSVPHRSKKHDRLPDVQLNAALEEVIFKLKETLDTQTKLPICSPFMHPVTDDIAPGCVARLASCRRAGLWCACMPFLLALVPETARA